MSRSTWKGPFTDFFHQKKPPASQTKIWSRRSQILPMHVGKVFLVHNGRYFVSVKCVESMCSHKWGEFAVTRKKASHKFNKRKQLHKSTKEKVKKK